MPGGFDMDLVLITQEPDIMLNKIGSLKFKIISMNDKVALVGVRLPSDKSVQYEFELYKSKEGWKNWPHLCPRIKREKIKRIQF